MLRFCDFEHSIRRNFLFFKILTFMIFSNDVMEVLTTPIRMLPYTLDYN